MKIAIINNLYFPFNHGGAEQVVRTMIQELRNSGHEVFLITSRPSGKFKSPTTDFPIYYLPSLIYNLDRLPSGLRFCWHLHNLFNLKKYYQLKKILQHTKPDLVITHNLLGLGFLTPRLIKKLKIRHQHVLHDIQLLHPSGLMLLGQEKKIKSFAARSYQYCTRYLFSSPEKVISPSRWLMAEHRQRGFFPDSQLEIKPFKIPIQEIKVKQNVLHQQGAEKVFLFVGQLEIQKGILWLIKVFQQLNNKAVKLIIVGSGPKEKEIKKLINPNSQIELRGQLNSSEVKKVMLASDYLIVPSLCYENSPTVIYEAQAVALPVIAAQIGGIPEILKNSDYLFPAGNEKELIRILMNKITNNKN